MRTTTGDAEGDVTIAAGARSACGAIPGTDLRARLLQEIRAQLPDGRPLAPRVARRAGLSVRGMQRLLARSDARFSELRQDLVMQCASELLRRSQFRITDIAHEVGYSDSANFTRAFRRWSGQTPRAYRRRYCEPPSPHR